jgi:TPR repeat protein
MKILTRQIDDLKWAGALEPAAALVEKKQYREAIALYDQAIERAEVVRAYTMRGYSYAQLGQYDKALADYDRSLALDPESACCSGTRSNRAQAYLALGQIDNGIADLVIAANSDNAWAARELAMTYAFGKYGVKPDNAIARRWCERAAKQGDALSMYCIGSLYHAGQGVPKDLKLAAQWFEGAAQRGIADAQADLAFMLWTGQGIAQDKDAAVRWWRAAAIQNNERAKGQLKNNLSWWEYFRQVSVAGWVEAQRNDRPWLYLLLAYLGLAAA